MRPLDPRVLPHLRPARAPLVAVAACGVAGAGLLVAQSFVLAGLLVALVRGEAWTSYAVALGLVVAARAAVSAGGDAAAASAAARVGQHLRAEVLDAALRLDPAGLARRRVGELAVLATRGVAAVEPYLTRYLPALVLAAVLPPLTLVAIASQDLWAALVVVLTLPLVPVFAALVGLATRDRVDRQWRALSALSGHFVDVVRGLPTLVAHRRARAQSDRIAAVTDRYRRANRDVLRLAFASSAVLELVATLSVAVVAVTVGLRLAGGGLDLTTALVVLLLAPEAYWPLRRVGAEFHAAAEGTATFDQIHALTSAAGATAPPALEASDRLELVAASVTWPGRSRPAVGPVSVALPARGLVAITGPSGSGKSTLLAGLLGEVPLSAGRLRVPAPDLDTWRTRTAYAGQSPWLVAGSVADNVRLGRPDADLADVLTALHAVGLDVAPDQPVGEDGRGLSAGQRARVALARVLVSDRPAVLLDEPTAHVDAATEAVLLRVVRDLARERLVVVVAHRPALVEAADLVVRLDATPISVAAGDVPHPAPVRGRSTQPSPAPRPERRGWRGRLAAATALGTLAATAGVALTATAGWLVVRSAEHPPVLMLITAIVGVRTFGLARPVLRYAERLLSHDVALRALAERRRRVYDDLVPLVPGRTGRRGDLLAAVVDDVDAVVDDLVRVRVPLATWAGATALSAAVTALFHPGAALVVAATGLLSGAGAYAVARLGTRRHGPARVAARAALSTRVLSTLQDARLLVLWRADTRARAEVAGAGADLGRATTATARHLAVARAWPLLVAGAGVVTAGAVAAGDVSGPVLALVALVPIALAEVAAPLADAGALRHETAAAAARLDALASTPPAVAQPHDPVDLPARRTDGPELRLDDVTASWGGEHDALRDLSLTVTPGRAVGVVGPSGSGKSTLAAVLVRFLETSAGRYAARGVDVRALRPDDVRRTVGLLDDEPHLFATSVLENVRLARPDATDDEVVAALAAARLGPWLATLPAGVQTRLGDGADAVSGGERARIGLARLLLGDHAVLVLDEPTAHLDHATATAVADDLLALRDQGRALVWITHTGHGLDRVDEVLTLGELPAETPTPARA